MDKNIKILGIKITDDSLESILEIIEKYVEISNLKSQNSKLKQQKPMIIFTPNPEIVMYSQKNREFKEIVNTAYINIPDGVGLQWASRVIGNPISHRVTGIDLMEASLNEFSDKPITIGLIGGFGDIALKTLECLKTKYPKLNVWADRGPLIKIKEKANNSLELDYSDWNLTDFIQRLKLNKTKILFVGFGFPKQEYFINEISKHLSGIVLVAVGGSFDYLTGNVNRAPKLIRNLGFEWLYRLLRQPWRIKRQLVLPQFIWKVLTLKYI